MGLPQADEFLRRQIMPKMVSVLHTFSAEFQRSGLNWWVRMKLFANCCSAEMTGNEGVIHAAEAEPLPVSQWVLPGNRPKQPGSWVCTPRPNFTSSYNVATYWFCGATRGDNRRLA